MSPGAMTTTSIRTPPSWTPAPNPSRPPDDICANMHHYICITCGTQYGVAHEPPTECRVCVDDRQHVGRNGQLWTTHDQLAASHHVRIEMDNDLTGVGIAEQFAIPQRALRVRSADAGNILWDCTSLITPHARDLQLFVDLFGYSTTEALVAATRLGCELMDYPVGQIRAGYLADILLVDGNPVDDISIMQHPDRITAIMKAGTFHKQPQPTH